MRHCQRLGERDLSLLKSKARPFGRQCEMRHSKVPNDQGHKTPRNRVETAVAGAPLPVFSTSEEQGNGMKKREMQSSNETMSGSQMLHGLVASSPLELGDSHPDRFREPGRAMKFSRHIMHTSDGGPALAWLGLARLRKQAPNSTVGKQTGRGDPFLPTGRRVSVRQGLRLGGRSACCTLLLPVDWCCFQHLDFFCFPTLACCCFPPSTLSPPSLALTASFSQSLSVISSLAAQGEPSLPFLLDAAEERGYGTPRHTSRRPRCSVTDFHARC